MQQMKQECRTGLHRLAKTILVVEDDESIGSILVDVLSLETSCHVLLATDAWQAIKIVMRNMVPNLLITDYQLPYMDGIKLYDYLLAQQKLADVPTIVMSARMPEDEVRKRGLASLKKPFELNELLNKVEKLLKAHEPSQS